MSNAKLSLLFVSPKDTVRKVMDRMAVNQKEARLPVGIVLVVDGNKKLLGIATDGDIRRAFTAGISAKAPISKAMNKNPFFIESAKDGMDVLMRVAEKIRNGKWTKKNFDRIIIVDKNQQVEDVVSFPDLLRSGDVRFKHIGIVGLGYVGLTLGLTLADLGFKVKGFDINKEVADSIRKGKPHFFEAGLDILLKDHSNKNFSVVDNFKKENSCDIYFVTVGTPLDQNNKPNLKHLEGAAQILGKVLKFGDTVILRSTVPVGTTRSLMVPVLEKLSGLKAGEGFLIAFAPERTIEGKALEELRRLPQVIGGFNRASADLTANVFSLMTNSTVILGSLEEAEMVKLVNNTYRDVTFAFANEVSLIAKKWGMDTKNIIEAANYGYERSSVPMPSPGVGGYCLEKDPFIFIESAKLKNYEPQLFKHARRVSDLMIDFVSGSAAAFLKNHKAEVKNPKILVMGLAFKGRPVTSDLRGSQALKLVEYLRNEGYKNIHGYDPAVRRSDMASRKVKHVADVKEGFQDVDLVMVMNNNPHFESLDIRNLLRGTNKPVMLFDTWSLYPKEEVEKVRGLLYQRL